MNSLRRSWSPHLPATGAKTDTVPQAGTAVLHSAHLPQQCIGRHRCKVQRYLSACTAAGPRDKFSSGGHSKRFRLAGMRDSGPSARTPNAAEPSFASTVMDAASSRSEGAEPSSATLQQWAGAYRLMAQEALTLGIPKSAIPSLPAQPTAQDLRAARERLEGMIQSFLSAAL